MKKLVIFIALIAIAWGSFWFIAKTRFEDNINEWKIAQENEGTDIEYNLTSITGFPNRFDAHFNDIRALSPNKKWQWRTDALTLITLAYKWNHLIALFPESHQFQINDTAFTLQNSAMKASLTAFNDKKHFDDMRIDARDIILAQANKPLLDIQNMFLALKKEDESAFRIAMQGSDINISALSEQFKTPFLSETLTFEGRAFASNRLEIDRFLLTMGEFNFDMAGTLALLDEGLLDGALILKIKNWQGFLEQQVALNIIPHDVALMIAFSMTQFTKNSANPNALEIPLIFKKGQLSIGTFHLDLGSIPLLNP